VQVGTVTASAIVEASGVAASHFNANVLWTHNDSGNPNNIFAVNATSGALLETFSLTGTTNTDWEDIAVSPNPISGSSYVYVGDIGDNGSVRPSINVYRIPEPHVTSGSANLTGAETFNLTYPDGAHNAESLMVDPINGDIYILTKAIGTGRLYRAAYPQSPSSTLAFVRNITINDATGGDISPDGSKLIIRNGGTSALEWTRLPGQSIADMFATSGPQTVTLHSETQGEAIGYSYPPLDSAGAGLFTMSEGTSQPLYFIPVIPEPACVGFLSAISIFMVRRKRTSSNQNIAHKRTTCWSKKHYRT
jgi:hypothetical protein